MTITPVPLPDQEPDLFEPAPGPAPVQYDLFEDELQQLVTPAHDRPAPLPC